MTDEDTRVEFDEVKACATCGHTRPHSDYYAHRRNPDGLRRSCKPCLRAQSREYHRNHTRDHRERCKRYYRDNLEAQRAKARDRHHQRKASQ